MTVIRKPEAADVIIDIQKPSTQVETGKAQAERHRKTEGKPEVQQPRTEDTVNISRAKLISSELLSTDKAARVQELKALIESDNYVYPPAEKLAEKMAEMIDEEIKFHKMLEPDDDGASEDGDKDDSTE